MFKKFAGLDMLAVALVALGALAVAAGLLPTAAARATGERILPLLIFLGAVIILAELAGEAGVFNVIASRVTILAKGRTSALFVLSILFAAITTAFLNLDTTAVLLTPVMLAAAARAKVPALPLAMTTVWLANAASLLLPVSNLTNLLAADRVGLTPLEFAARMALPQLAALGSVAACLWLFYWRQAPTRYEPPAPYVPRDRRTFIAAGAGCLLFLAGVLVGQTKWVLAAVSAGAATLVTVAFLRWDRGYLTRRLFPWRLLVLVTGLFLVVDTIGRHGLSEWMAWLIGSSPGAEGVLRAAATGGLLSNVLNNLPAYVAGEAVVALAHHDQLLGLLIGTNIGPLITPWASLATLLWAQHCRSAGLDIRWGRFVAAGAVTSTVALTAATAALLIPS